MTTADVPKRIGRPPEPVPEDIAIALCDWIAAGLPLRAFCRLPGMPSRPTIDRWRLDDAEFASRVARARDTGFDALAEEALAIADDATLDTIETEDGRRMDSEWVARSKLRVETRLKLLACWDPRRYGQKHQEGSASVSITVTTGVPAQSPRIIATDAIPQVAKPKLVSDS